MSLTLILLAATTLAGAALLWARRRGVRAETYQLFRCPGCDQKVRYPASKAGRAGVCPRCRHPWVLPVAPRQPVRTRHPVPGTAETSGRLCWRPTRLTTAGLPARRS